MFNVDTTTKNTLDNLNLEEVKKEISALSSRFSSSLTKYFTSLIQNKMGDGFLVGVVDSRISKDFSQIFIEVLELGVSDESSYILATFNKTKESNDTDIEISFKQFSLERINEIVKETDIRHIYDIAKAILDNKIL